MEATNLILMGMLAVTPEEYRPTRGSERMETYEAIAGDIHAAATHPLGALPFEGPAAIQATEDGLTAISANESSYRQSVRDCRKKGDNGNSISIFQIYRGKSRQGHSEKEICSNPVLAAQLAINLLGWYAVSAPKLENLFAGYARGTTMEPNYASSRQLKVFNKLIEMHNIKITKKRGQKFYAEFVEPQSEEVIASANASRPWIVSFAP